jgi:thioredoxin reductase/Fe-S-cluster-containing hydrogenase component 2
MKRYDLIVIGAGPAGLSAAITSAKYGLKTVIFDENQRPGGQLFKQIHKFFGSKEHKARIRGFKIGEELLTQAQELGVEVVLNAPVIGLYPEKEVAVRINDCVSHYKGDTVVIATGATENAVYFDGWDLPGVISAGAAQTMMNLHGVMPGERILMLGTGNVGLVVAFQLLQADRECLVAMVDAAPAVGGYGVHAAKVARLGIPFYLSHTIVKAEGKARVSKVTIAEVDVKFKPLSGTEKIFDVDTVCLAVGLSPMVNLLKMAGCTITDNPAQGGPAPLVDQFGQTSVEGLFAAGDVSGIEEASSAMIEGRLAGLAASKFLGYLTEEEAEEEIKQNKKALSDLRGGMFSPSKKGKKIEVTDEGIAVSTNLLRKGFLAEDEISRFPGITQISDLGPVLECTQNIPCNPCRDVCPRNCIKIEGSITSLPKFDQKTKCSGCAYCVAACPGQAIFLVDPDIGNGYASVTIPYEFQPLPKEGDEGIGLSRSGREVCQATVIKMRSSLSFDQTNLLTIKVPKEMAMTARFYKRRA